ncbi:MAG TPA: TonB-dependent receptor [Steroidobacteraceae bacterium]|nr:TonB-dependent receptor [Steroidobacteraceae bacterium]
MRNETGAMSHRFHKYSFVAAILGVVFSSGAFAQSTGTEAVEESMTEVVVSATRIRNIGMVGDQTAPKSRVSLSSEYLATQAPGQSIFQSINQIPGVNFTNSDAYGTSGGNLRIRGFDGSRVSVTFDGVPLNDSGNYALFTNQMLDPELVDRVDVNLGTTDVDSPTASATGGTVAYKTRRPQDEAGGQAVISYGDENYRRAFLRVDTGEWGSLGTKAFVSASYQNYDKFKGPGELTRKQVNAAVRQDWENENFIQLAVHYNQNRNAFYRTSSIANFNAFGRDYENLDTCTRDAPTAGVADNENFLPPFGTPQPPPPTPLFADNPIYTGSCTNYYGVRINPSDTGNIRMQSLWHLGDKLLLTFDPSWQYTLANGGGTTTIAERPGTSADVRQIGSANVTGWDLNGDGDTLDTVRFYTPNNTNTRRWGATTSLIWNLNDDNRLRFAYTWDRARHRQTAQWGYMDEDGTPENVFAGREGDRVFAADGDILRGRDRLSIAELKQYALEYRGQFLDDKFTATVGVRAPYFTRELNQYCYTPNGQTGNSSTTFTSSTLCTSRLPSATLANGNVIFNGNTATQYISPYSETVKFDDILPNLGLSWSLTSNQQVYFSYAEGLSAPRTDNLYSVRRQPDGSIGRPTPESETTKAYDLGWRVNGSSTIASVAVYRIDYSNRIVSSFDPDLGFSVDRNVGDVKIQGLDFQVGQRLGSMVSVTASASYNDSELLENVPTATGFIATKGKKLVETPEWTYSARADFEVTDSVHFGLQGKKVGARYGTDLNDEIAPNYTIFDLDASWSFPMGDKKGQILVNLTNITDEEYYGTISSGTGGGSVGFYSIGAPRTLMGSFKFEF